jgi:hypothetical protein
VKGMIRMSKSEKGQFKRGIVDLLLALDLLVLFLSGTAIFSVGTSAVAWIVVNIATIILFFVLFALCLKNYAKKFVNSLKTLG